MQKKSNAVKKVSPQSNDKYQTSIYLDYKDIEAVKAIAVAKDLTLSSVIVNLMRDGLKNGEYQDIIQAYQQFKDKVS